MGCMLCMPQPSRVSSHHFTRNFKTISAGSRADRHSDQILQAAQKKAAAALPPASTAGGPASTRPNTAPIQRGINGASSARPIGPGIASTAPPARGPASASNLAQAYRTGPASTMRSQPPMQGPPPGAFSRSHPDPRGGSPMRPPVNGHPGQRPPPNGYDPRGDPRDPRNARSAPGAPNRGPPPPGAGRRF